MSQGGPPNRHVLFTPALRRGVPGALPGPPLSRDLRGQTSTALPGTVSIAITAPDRRRRIGCGLMKPENRWGWGDHRFFFMSTGIVDSVFIFLLKPNWILKVLHMASLIHQESALFRCGRSPVGHLTMWKVFVGSSQLELLPHGSGCNPLHCGRHSGAA